MPDLHDEMTSPTRIFNCFNGHIYEGCKQKKCRTNIIDRATDIENYLTICTFSQMFVPILSISIYIYLEVINKNWISDYFIPPDIYFFAYIFLRFCFAICCLRFLFMFVQMFELDA